MNTYTIFHGAIAWDECRADSAPQALVIAKARYPEWNGVWVRNTRPTSQDRSAA